MYRCWRGILHAGKIGFVFLPQVNIFKLENPTLLFKATVNKDMVLPFSTIFSINIAFIYFDSPVFLPMRFLSSHCSIMLIIFSVSLCSLQLLGLYFRVLNYLIETSFYPNF